MRKPTPPLSDLMGNGRYFYVACANGIGLKVVDSTLLTSGNYLGAGAWTSNPVIATISARYGKVCYDGLHKQVVMTDSVANRIYLIDADPTSATFNTQLGSIDLTGSPGTTSTTVIGYDFVNNIFMLGPSGGNFSIYDKDWKFIRKMTFTGSYSRNRIIFYDSVNNNFISSDEAFGAYVVPSSTDSSKRPVGGDFLAYGVANNESYHFTTDKYLVKLNNGSLIFYNLLTGVYVTTVTIANTRRCGIGYDHVNKRIITGSLFSNSFSFTRLDTLAGDGTLAKGSTDTGENGTVEIVATGGVAVAQSYYGSATTKFLHAIDTANKAYVGYVDMGAGAFSLTAYESGFICKNAINYFEQ